MRLREEILPVPASAYSSSMCVIYKGLIHEQSLILIASLSQVQPDWSTHARGRVADHLVQIRSTAKQG